MVETLMILAAVILFIMVIQHKSKLQQVENKLVEMDEVNTKAKVMIESGFALNNLKRKSIDEHSEAFSACIGELEGERRIWQAKRRDYEAAIHKQTKSRKKVRGKKRKLQ